MDALAGDMPVWSVAEAKSRLSEVLRLAETDGPQVIGVRRPFVVVPVDVWLARSSDRKPLGQWLAENMPRGDDIPLPERKEPGREIPFVSGDAE